MAGGVAGTLGGLLSELSTHQVAGDVLTVFKGVQGTCYQEL
jgi:hypothetical protein